MREQEQWENIGEKQLDDFGNFPERHIVENIVRYRPGNTVICEILGPLRNKKVLELGCGWGEFAVYLARQGAQVTGIDIGPALIAAAQELNNINHTNCNFLVGNITALPIEEKAFDIVIGVAVLHHLSENEVIATMEETQRVLKDKGLAVFYEPVENSKVFDFIQNLFPAGKKGEAYYRPSILLRKSWNIYVGKLEDRVMTTKELLRAGAEAEFHIVRIVPIGFLVRLARFLDGSRKARGFEDFIKLIDEILLKIIPPLRHLSQAVVVVFSKA